MKNSRRSMISRVGSLRPIANWRSPISGICATALAPIWRAWGLGRGAKRAECAKAFLRPPRVADETLLADRLPVRFSRPTGKWDLSAAPRAKKNPGAFAPGFPFLNRARRSPVAGDLEATFESIATTLKGLVRARRGDKAIRRLGLALLIEHFDLEIEILDRIPVADHADEPARAIGDDRSRVRSAPIHLTIAALERTRDFRREVMVEFARNRPSRWCREAVARRILVGIGEGH